MLSFASINVQHSENLDRLQTFLSQNTFHAVCLQEICKEDLPFFQNLIGPHAAYAPMTHTRGKEVGVAIISPLPLENTQTYFYKGNSSHTPTETFTSDGWPEPLSKNYPLLCTSVCWEGKTYRIGTTHFCWSYKGQSTPEQLADLDKLLESLKNEPELVLCGDFNAPRGRETFTRLAAGYTDNIPHHYQTSLDLTLHRAPMEEKIDKMVDGLFTTPSYKAENVQFHSGVSDHQALTAILTRP